MDSARSDMGSVTVTRPDLYSGRRVIVHAKAFLLAAEMKPGYNPPAEVGGESMLDNDRRQIFHGLRPENSGDLRQEPAVCL